MKLITPLTQVDSSAAFTVGSRTVTKDGNEYIYLPGTTSVEAQDWVTFTSASGSVTRLATTGAKGQVAVAISAVISNTYGWFCTKGLVNAKWGAGVTTAGSVLYASGTAAYAGTTVVAGDLLAGAFLSGTAASGSAACWINKPFCTDTIS